MARIDNINMQPVDLSGDRARPDLALIGVSHHTADFEVLERAALDEQACRRAARTLCESPGVVEAAIVTTCNRTEICLVSENHEQAVRSARDLLASTGLTDADVAYVKYGRDVAAHLFRVAAGLDSLMVGEVQILGQVKRALRIAEEEQAAGALIGRLFASAFRAGKRARTETAIGAGAVSVSYAALGLAQKIFSDLRERTVLVIGAGATGTLAATHFAEAGVAELLITNRTNDRAAALAERLGGRGVPYAGFAEQLSAADIVVTATSAPAAIIDRDMVAPARSGRAKRPLVFIDIALPRDVDPKVNELEGVFVHDMEALKSIVDKNLERRRREVPNVEAIIVQEVERFQTWEASLEVGPTIRDLKQHVEEIRTGTLSELRGQLDDKSYERVDRATRTMMNKLMHQPVTQLRRPPRGSGHPMQIAAIFRRMFGLDAHGDSDS